MVPTSDELPEQILGSPSQRQAEWQAADDPSKKVQQLRQQIMDAIGCRVGGTRYGENSKGGEGVDNSSREPRASTFSSGNPRLDALLPGGGFRRSSLVEWFGAGMGSGASIGAWWGAVAACQAGGVLVIVDIPWMEKGGQALFYPPAVEGDLPAEQIVMVRPAHEKDAIWSLDQALRSRAVGAVWTRLSHLSPRDFRRLQLSAEEGGALGCLVRPLHVRGQPSWADLQIEVRSQGTPQGGWQVQFHLLRGRGVARPSTVHVEWNT